MPSLLTAARQQGNIYRHIPHHGKTILPYFKQILHYFLTELRMDGRIPGNSGIPSRIFNGVPLQSIHDGGATSLPAFMRNTFRNPADDAIDGWQLIEHADGKIGYFRIRP